MAGHHPPRLQVDLVRLEPNRFSITAKLKKSYSAPWEHVGGTVVNGNARQARRESRRIAAELAAEFGIDPQWVEVT